MRKILFISLLSIFVSACGVPAKGILPTAMATNPVLQASATAPIAPPPKTIAAPTLAAVTEDVSDIRLPPERWQEWPIVPAVTKRALEIYQQGLGMGLDEHSFSKVGDCQSVKAAFMGYFDIPERYSLGKDYAYLQETVDAFTGHFNTDGQAVRGGFNAAAVLSPLWADPKACLAGENPLECELRISKPIIVIVSLEVWWDGRTPAQYESLMRRILDTIIAHGAVPVLATKADNVEGDNSLNLTTARLAYEYDLPLWNFWAAVQPLPAHGMDMNRKDGFHISTEAWSTRSFTGLEALDSVWRGLVQSTQANAGPAHQAATPTLMLMPDEQGELTPLATPRASASEPPIRQVVFGLAQRSGEAYTYPGVYLLNVDTQQTDQLFGAGVRLQSAAPDGKSLLVSKGSILYRTNADGTAPIKLTESLYTFGNMSAVWLPNGLIATVLEGAGSPHMVLLSDTGQMVREIKTTTTAPVEIYPSSNERMLYWEAGSCSLNEVCQRSGAWVTSLEDDVSKPLANAAVPELSADGTRLAGETVPPNSQNGLTFSGPTGASPRFYPLPGTNMAAYAWSPEGDALAAIVAVVSDYSGKVTKNRNFVIYPQTLAISEFAQSNLLNPHVLWAPDGKQLLWMGTQPGANGYDIGGSLVDLSTKRIVDLDQAIGLSNPNYLVVTNANWLPLP